MKHILLIILISINLNAFEKREFLIKYKKAPLSGRSIKKLKYSNVHLVKVEDKESFEQLRNDKNIESIQENLKYHTYSIPNDPKYNDMWGIQYFERVWNHITDCSDVVIAVIDTGVNYNHEELRNNMWVSKNYPNHGYSFIENAKDRFNPMDYNGHGTHVAGTIAAEGNNKVGGAGACYKAQIMAVQVLDANGGGKTSTIIEGINFAVANGAQIINMSLGGPGKDSLLEDAITNAKNHGVLVIVAAGNDHENNDTSKLASYPCAINSENLICVGAIDNEKKLAEFSNYGKTTVQIAAPGVSILSSINGKTLSTYDDFSTWTIGESYGVTKRQSQSGNTYYQLSLPSNYTGTSGKYSANLQTTASKKFNLDGNEDLIKASFFFNANLINDNVSSYCSQDQTKLYDKESIIGEPFSEKMKDEIIFVEDVLDNCKGNTTCNYGFKFVSGTSVSPDSFGFFMALFSIDKLYITPNEYDSFKGTSMAAPHVAGLAALLKAYNKDFNYSQIKSSILNGGQTIDGLSGYIKGGKILDSIGSFKYINKPKGIKVTVQ